MYQALADLTLVVHAGFVVFVVAGLALIIAGNLRRWPWVNHLWFRLLHLVAIGIVVAQAWLGQSCPLTDLERWLRHQAGEQMHDTAFVQYWLEKLLYYQAPAWAFTLVYTLFGLAVLITWWRFPPRRQARRAAGREDR